MGSYTFLIGSYGFNMVNLGRSVRRNLLKLLLTVEDRRFFDISWRKRPRFAWRYSLKPWSWGLRPHDQRFAKTTACRHVNVEIWTFLDTHPSVTAYDFIDKFWSLSEQEFVWCDRGVRVKKCPDLNINVPASSRFRKALIMGPWL